MIGFTAAFAKTINIIFSKCTHPVLIELFNNILNCASCGDIDMDFFLYNTDNYSKEDFERILTENGFTFELTYVEENVGYDYNISWK